MILDQNLQFYITVGTTIAVFLWLRNDLNRLDAKIDREIDGLKTDINSLQSEVNSLRSEVTSIREGLGWLRGRMGYSEPNSTEKES